MAIREHVRQFDLSNAMDATVADFLGRLALTHREHYRGNVFRVLLPLSMGRMYETYLFTVDGEVVAACVLGSDTAYAYLTGTVGERDGELAELRGIVTELYGDVPTVVVYGIEIGAQSGR